MFPFTQCQSRTERSHRDTRSWDLCHTGKTVSCDWTQLLLFLCPTFSKQQKDWGGGLKIAQQRLRAAVLQHRPKLFKHTTLPICRFLLLWKRECGTNVAMNDGKTAAGVNGNQLGACVSQERAAVYCLSLLRLVMSFPPTPSQQHSVLYSTQRNKEPPANHRKNILLLLLSVSINDAMVI